MVDLCEELDLIFIIYINKKRKSFKNILIVM